MSISRVLVFLSAALLSSGLFFNIAFAQSGLELPCVDCPTPETSMRIVRPASGLWFNSEQSGTGFMMEAKGDVLVGHYFLYDDDGEPVWYMFVSSLEPSEEPDTRLVAEAQLGKFTDGSCLECEYRFPEHELLDKTLRIEFINRNYARFRIDEGPYQFINTLLFGMNGAQIFQPYSDYVFPDLSGSWVFTFQSAFYGSLNSGVFLLRDLPEDPQYAARYQVLFVAGYPGDADLLYVLGGLDCINRAEMGPLCELVFDGPHASDSLRDRVFYIRPGDISDSRIFGETEDGWNVEVFRLGQD